MPLLAVRHSWRNRLLLAVAPVFTIVVMPVALVLYAAFWTHEQLRVRLG